MTSVPVLRRTGADSPTDLDRKLSRTSDETKFLLAQPLDPLYEGRHRYDPTAEWTEEEEKHVTRKVDVRVMSWLCLAFFCLQLDRGNISYGEQTEQLAPTSEADLFPGSALADGMLKDLNVNTNDYNNGQTIFVSKLSNLSRIN